MDINDVRAWFTVIMLVMFVAIVVWAYSKKRKKDFHDAAHLPLNEPEQPRKKNEGGDQ